MGVYRLEVWFDYPNGTIDWGIAQAPAQQPDPGNPPFSNGGTGLPKNNGIVQINGAGNNSSFDVYVFDVSNDQTQRDLVWIEIDYEKAQGSGSSGRDPFSQAEQLRLGQSGADFSGSFNGYTSGVGQENTIFSAPSGTPAAQRRWSLITGFEGLTPGYYTFDVSVVVAPANGAKVMAFDPEMEINP